MNYKSAIEKIRSERKNDLLLYEALYVNALRENPKLREIDGRIYDIKKTDGDNSELESLFKFKEDYIKRLNLIPPEPKCLQCSDTGYKPSGKLCACIINAVFSNQQYKHTFDDFDFEVFDAGDLANVKRAYDTAVAFCTKFPSTNALNLIFLGATGTGKTFLASCIADSLSKSGYSVVFCSAFAFVNKMLAYHTAPVNEKLDHISPILDCDLLIIDDLGTESMLKNVTAEYFYTILNERMRLNLHTLFTTNLDNEKIGLRYGERFSSRLFDRRFSRGFALGSKDLRKKT